MSYKTMYCFFVFIFLYTTPLAAESWKVFFYMEASDGLTDMAFKNITDMMRVPLNNDVDLVIQLHAYDNKALRYQATSAGLKFLEETEISGNCKQDFIDATTWAFANNAADHTMLIFSDHGWGALDPRWNEETESWEVTGLNLANNGNEPCNGSNICPLNNTTFKTRQEIHMQHKGFMFTVEPRSYLSNRALAEGLNELYNTILQHKKIDIIAFDTCMGSMLEVATCIAPYANYLVGVQSCALRDGFDYQGFIKILKQGLAPRHTASEFIHVFDRYYALHDAKGIYTCAALDLSLINTVNNALNDVVAQLLARTELLPVLQEARTQSPRFCLWPIYTDLVAYCKLIEAGLATQPASDLLIQSLHNLYKVSDAMVVARCGGRSTVGNAHGFSIYLPPHDYEDSYSRSLFAEHSQWPQLLITLSTSEND